MTSQEKRRQGYLAHQKKRAMKRWAAKHTQQQVGADPARNVGGTDLLDKIEDGGIVWLENVTEKEHGI